MTDDLEARLRGARTFRGDRMVEMPEALRDEAVNCLRQLMASREMIWQTLKKAEADYAAQFDRLRVYREALEECADDLASEIEARYEGVRDHPAMKRKYDRDMLPVLRARQALQVRP